MPAIEIGRICTKITGREIGRKCVIVDLIDKNFILITGPKKITGIKRRRVNVSHVEPTTEKIKLERGANDDDVAKALETANKTEEMKIIIKAKPT